MLPKRYKDYREQLESLKWTQESDKTCKKQQLFQLMNKSW